MAKKVTITNTRPSSAIPWFYEVASGSEWESQEQFVLVNSEKVTYHADTVGNVQTVVLTFSDDAVFADYKRTLQLGIKSEYVQYCEDNNITINVVMEDI